MCRVFQHFPEVKRGNATLILNHDRFQQGYQNGRRYYFEDWSPEEQQKRLAEWVIIPETVPLD